MSTVSTADSSAFVSEKISTPNTLQDVISGTLPQFERLIHLYALFNGGFLVAGCAEFLILLLFFTFFAKSALLALSLGVIFLTFFSYFTLRVYLQTKKPEQFEDLKNQYLEQCKTLIGYQEGDPEKYLALASACTKLSDSLIGKEHTFYSLPHWLKPLSPYMEKLCYWYHWQDVHYMRELILLSAIEENIKYVKFEPTSLEAHASLANAYVTLSTLYAHTQNSEIDDETWMPREEKETVLSQKFKKAAERAIEEFKILNDFAPNDPWIHVQLAYSYHDLNMPLQEIYEYEIVLSLLPEDQETLYKLGILYFKQGRNADGLRIFEQLKQQDAQKANEIISYYGAYKPFSHE